MRRAFSRSASFILPAAACLAGPANAGIVCPDSMYATVTFATSHDRVTILPNGAGDTFASLGITIHVYLRNCQGVPIPGVPRQEIVLFNSALCFCPGGNIADADTDVNGHTTFTGTLQAGGCTESLTVFADGVAIATLPVKTSSPDHVPSSPCFVDAGDLSSLAFRLGRPDRYSPCYDYNHSGPPTITAGDLSYFAAALSATCP